MTVEMLPIRLLLVLSAEVCARLTLSVLPRCCMSSTIHISRRCLAVIACLHLCILLSMLAFITRLMTC